MVRVKEPGAAQLPLDDDEATLRAPAERPGSGVADRCRKRRTISAKVDTLDARASDS